MSDHDDDASDINNDNAQPQQQQNIQPQIITTVSNNNAKFPYLKKDEYEVWAMKMEYWITNNDMNIWKVIQNGNSLKRTGRDRDGRVIILPPTTADEHIAVQRESKARTTLLQSIPDDHVADFHYMDDARDIWNAVKARFGGNAESKKMRKSMLKQEFSEFRISESEGLHKGYDRMQKILSQLNQLKAKPDDEDINLKFLRGLPSSWSQVALTLKTKGGLELLSFDDLYYKLKTLEIDIKGYSTHSSSQSPSHSAFVSTTSTSKKMSYAESPSFSSSTTYSAPSSSKARSHSSGNVLQDVLHSLVAESEPEQQVAYEDFEQIDKLDLEEMDIKWQMAMLSVRVNKFEKKAGRKIEFDKKEAARFNKKAVRCYKCLQKGHFSRECMNHHKKTLLPLSQTMIHYNRTHFHLVILVTLMLDKLSFHHKVSIKLNSHNPHFLIYSSIHMLLVCFMLKLHPYLKVTTKLKLHYLHLQVEKCSLMTLINFKTYQTF
ncbi:ribonuclease H-like domain-containing protein [Tanacetum coccineum]